MIDSHCYGNEWLMQRVKCPRCGDLVPKTAYCVYCGESLKNSEPIQPNTTIFCPHCEKKVPSLEFCINCGNKISEVKSTVQEKPLGRKKCPLCRKETPENHNFCHYCGGKLKEGDLAAQSQPICNRCWKPNPPNIGYCIHCGFKQHTMQSTFLDKPFEGFQLDISDLLQKTPISLAMMKLNTNSSKNFPIKSTIVHSRYFGVSKSEKTSKFRRNFGSFDASNIRNYLGTSILIILLYAFWYFRKYINLVNNTDPSLDIVFILLFGGLLASLLLSPIWLSTFMVFRTTGNKLNYQIDPTKVIITLIFNFIWSYFFPGFGPIILQMGGFNDPQDRTILQKPFIRGIAWGAIFTVGTTLFLTLSAILTLGYPGIFAGFLFTDHQIKSHIISSFFGATWISIIFMLPFGDYFDRVIRHWNQLGYFILLAVSFICLIISYQLMQFVTQMAF